MLKLAVPAGRDIVGAIFGPGARRRAGATDPSGVPEAMDGPAIDTSKGETAALRRSRTIPATPTPSFIRHPSGLRDHPALVLNADYRPLSYLPLSLWPWQEAIKAAFLDRVIVLAEYDAVVRSPSVVIALPSVVVLKEYVKPAKTAAFTRFNLFLRDEFTCQYCGAKDGLTFDHIVPRSRGGRTTWTNVVASCGPCNLRKGSKTLRQAGMSLRRPALRPSPEQLQNVGRKFPPNHLHDSWMDYLYWDAELEA
jgi:5-methylcytosine-specific restriction endonuclease McrA